MKEYSFKYKIDNVLSYNPRRCNLPHLVAANKSGFLRAYSMIKDRFRYRYVYEYVLMTTSMFDGLPCSVFLHDVRRKRLPDVVSDVVMLAALGPWSRDPEDYDDVFTPSCWSLVTRGAAARSPAVLLEPSCSCHSRSGLLAAGYSPELQITIHVTALLTTGWTKKNWDLKSMYIALRAIKIKQIKF